jgi:hypothetical protein
VAPNISEGHIAFIFGEQSVLFELLDPAEEGTMTLQNVMNYLPCETVLHCRIL